MRMSSLVCNVGIGNIVKFSDSPSTGPKMVNVLKCNKIITFYLPKFFLSKCTGVE